MIINDDDDDDDEPTDLGVPILRQTHIQGARHEFRCPNICQTSEASILKNY